MFYQESDSIKKDIPKTFSTQKRRIKIVIIVKVLFPPTSATEVGKRFPGMPTIPDFITRKGPYVSSTTADGIVVISFFEFDNSRTAEAMNSVGNYYASSRDIPGYTYSIEMFFEVQEALKMIGLE